MPHGPGSIRTLGAAALLAALLPGSVSAQDPAPRPVVAASGRASTSVAFDGRLVGRIWLNRSTAHSGPALLAIDYGQPHARGRTVFGDLVPFGEPWRLGANMATHLRADLDVEIGGLRIPQGTYTLYLIPRSDGADLVVNRSTGQWGTVYDPAQDLGRTPMEVRELGDPVESLVIALAPVVATPGDDTLPSGRLTIAWGQREYAAGWTVPWPPDGAER